MEAVDSRGGNYQKMALNLEGFFAPMAQKPENIKSYQSLVERVRGFFWKLQGFKCTIWELKTPAALISVQEVSSGELVPLRITKVSIPDQTLLVQTSSRRDQRWVEDILIGPSDKESRPPTMAEMYRFFYSYCFSSLSYNRFAKTPLF
ncbi:hypothetical protein HYS94_04305 [Candidatus Daviesbacteria bacterium]|nr:hypothetical protein [Candidatus Daviesbacteria bacterium]